MKQFFSNLWKRFYNRETISYVLFGSLTTVVDFAVYNLTFQPMKDVIGETVANLLANALAWCAAVVFSYAVNKWIVFRTHAANRHELKMEMIKFVGSRVFSLVVSEIGMFALFSGAEWDENVSKAIVSVVVMIMNYVFMKLVVFKKPKEQKPKDN